MTNQEQEINHTATENKGHSFGTFAGVFTPSILTIFGLIMFLRASYVIGCSGILMAIVIALTAKSITLTTGLSISAISTNTPVKGGGVYFLISRALGPSFGTSIGISLFFAQTLSVPFYILGFAEAVATNIPQLQPYFLFLALTPAILLFITAWIGTDWAIKTQFFILLILGLSIISFMLGGLFAPFSFEQFSANLMPEKNFRFFYFFAIFFPAVTGIMAGVNMSGDLKNPQKSIPKGTLWAILIGGIVYLLQIIITGGAFPREELINTPYKVLVDNAIFKTGYLVFAGVIAATISSALGSMLGAPRILQALAKDKVLKFFNPFAVGAGKNNEPRRAMLFTFTITIIVLIWGGMKGLNLDDAEDDPLNIVARIVSMFFLYTYAMVNLAAFVESFGANPSFRPRFKYFHWSNSLFGAVACIFISFAIDVPASFVALVVMTILFFIVKQRSMQRTYGDARRGFIYSRIRNNLLNLAKMPADPKNWRPTIAVLGGNPEKRPALVEYAALFGDKRGILSLIKIVVGDTENLRKIRKQELAKLNEFGKINQLNFFPEVIVSDNFDEALKVFMQCHSLGPIKPNIMMTGWPHEKERVKPFFNHIKTIGGLGLNCLTMINPRDEKIPLMPHGTIDIWWRGMANGSLMVVLAYLLTQNREWRNVKIRLLRMAEKEHYSEEVAEMNKLVAAARVEAEVKVLTSKKGFFELFNYISKDAAVIFMGMRIPKSEDYDSFYETMNNHLATMPPTFLVASNGEANLTA